MSMRVWGDGPGEDVPGLTGRRKLAELAARFSGRLTIGVAAVATTILLGLLAVAAFTLPAQCQLDPVRPGQCLASTPAVAVAQPAAASSGSSVAVAKPLAATTTGATAAAQPESGSSTRAGSLISATFDQLPAASAPAANDSAVPAPASTVPGAPTTRVVSTTVVHADEAPAAPLSTQGMQIFEQAPDPGPAAPAAAVAADPVPLATAPAATPAPAADAIVASVAPQPTAAAPIVPASPPKRAAVPAPATTGGGMFVSSGSGVTVRSSPGRGGSQLFALARGQKVTVTGKERGWLQIVDAQGRRGWAYSTFFGNH